MDFICGFFHGFGGWGLSWFDHEALGGGLNHRVIVSGRAFLSFSYRVHFGWFFVKLAASLPEPKSTVKTFRQTDYQSVCNSHKSIKFATFEKSKT